MLDLTIYGQPELNHLVYRIVNSSGFIINLLDCVMNTEDSTTFMVNHFRFNDKLQEYTIWPRYFTNTGLLHNTKFGTELPISVFFQGLEKGLYEIESYEPPTYQPKDTAWYHARIDIEQEQFILELRYDIEKD